jgi:hypothetical protein
MAKTCFEPDVGVIALVFEPDLFIFVRERINACGVEAFLGDALTTGSILESVSRVVPVACMGNEQLQGIGTGFLVNLVPGCTGCAVPFGNDAQHCC